jgi:thymidylate synthase (FAD)
VPAVNVYSSCWVGCNPRSLMHFLSLRTHEPEAAHVSYPQAEIEQAARVAEDFLRVGWPITYEAYCRHGRVAP